MTDCKEHSHERAMQAAKDNALSDEVLQEISGIYKAIGEPSRLKILLALTEGDMCVYHISEVTGQKQSLTSHQLRVLKSSNIVKSRREGQTIIYSIADEHIKAIINMSLIHLNCL